MHYDYLGKESLHNRAIFRWPTSSNYREEKVVKARSRAKEEILWLDGGDALGKPSWRK